MSTKDIVQNLKQRQKELKEELTRIDELLSFYSSSNGASGKQNKGTGFSPVITSKEKSETLTSKAKDGIKELMNYPLSYQKKDIIYNLDQMGVDVTEATLHTALKALREEGKVMGYKINRSNQNVYYMSKKGIDKEKENYPIKKEYRPNSVDSEDVEEFEFLD